VRAVPEVFIGTSGWTYSDWRGRFYPPEIRSADYLAWYAQYFSTVEVNYSFYHLPRPSTYERWRQQTPDHFIFAVKASRVITHVKRLEHAQAEWKKFLKSAVPLGDKLGPVLLQFPASFRRADAHLAAFLSFTRKSANDHQSLQLALEFRHDSWLVPEVYAIMQEFQAAVVIAQSSCYPEAPFVDSAPFVYLRFHGPGDLFASSYSVEQLQQWAVRIRSWLAAGKKIYAYFNNDFRGNAVDNARTLERLIQCGSISGAG